MADSKLYTKDSIESLVLRMEKCHTKEEIDFEWRKYKDFLNDDVLIEWVQEYLAKYYSHYFILTLDKTFNIIYQRLLGEFNHV